MVKSVPVDPFSHLGLGPDILSFFVYYSNTCSRNVEIECKLNLTGNFDCQLACPKIMFLES